MAKRRNHARVDTQALYAELGEANEMALTADGFEAAYLGILYRFGQNPIACYDRARCIAILMERDGMSLDEAEEFFEFNVIGAGAGEGTPCFLELAR